MRVELRVGSRSFWHAIVTILIGSVIFLGNACLSWGGRETFLGTKSLIHKMGQSDGGVVGSVAETAVYGQPWWLIPMFFDKVQDGYPFFRWVETWGFVVCGTLISWIIYMLMYFFIGPVVVRALKGPAVRALFNPVVRALYDPTSRFAWLTQRKAARTLTWEKKE